jgi:hypothetical protein
MKRQQEAATPSDLVRVDPSTDQATRLSARAALEAASAVQHLSMQAPPSTQPVVSMHDYLGRRVKRWTAAVSGDGNLRLITDISGLRSGVYECRVATEESTTRRMINIIR